MMNIKPPSKYIRLILIVFAFALCFSLSGCAETPTEATTPAETTPEATTPTDTTPAETTPAETTPAELPPVCYTATVSPSDNVIASPYTGDVTVPEVLSGIYYSADAPGGIPQADGTGKIWLVLKPTQRYKVSEIKIEGVYSHVESLGRDLYCIHGVGSDLSVSTSVKRMYNSSKEMLEDFGYGISEDGKLTVRWAEASDVPLRYIEINYDDGENTYTEYVDAATEELEYLELTENTRYTFSVRAVGYERVGKNIDFEVCYMTAPKGVSFPRVEITTENYVWPDCDVVHSPDKYWGSGVTNALYQQCIMTVYDENNNVVYDSSLEMKEGEAYLGAKMKIRGNTSAAHAANEKYPYKIKLSTKADLLAPLIGRPDDGKAYEDKDWLLLNFGEEGYRIGGDAIADAVGTAWSPDYCYVSLYVNGDYRGLYVLSESVKRGNGTGEEQARVAVDKSGYVFECDAYWWNESLYFNTPMTEKTAMFYTFKHPDPDDIDTASPQYAYIKDYMTRFEEALMQDDDSYLDYIDLDSFVKWLLVSDYLCISDGGGANIFLYKKDATDNSKVFLGPNWDFDSWMGDVQGLSTIRMYWTNSPFYFPYLLKKESFTERYKELFYETREKLEAYIDDAFAQTDNEAHLQLLECDNVRFGTTVKSLSDTKEEFKVWLDEHIRWMESQLN
ncbi:MAG: CotH kinase family protein [Clostridia bacterium]|nr:CotH kinase family protein [Clostridia bacterium]